MDDIVEQWERQPDETAPAFFAFRTYRDLQPNGRSLARAVRAMYPDADDKARNAKLRQWQKWSSNHRWVDRATAWDDEQDRVRRQAYLAELDEMSRRHANLAMAMIGKAAQKLNALDAKELTVTDMRAMFQEAVRLERLARGVPESNAGVTTKRLDVTTLTDEELDALRRS
mgnify:CR=1 FL=1